GVVGAAAAGGDQRSRLAVAVAEYLQPDAQPVGDDLDHALLKRGAEVAHVLVTQGGDLLCLEPQRGLQARERKVGVWAAQHRPWQREALGGAGERLLLALRAAGAAHSPP